MRALNVHSFCLEEIPKKDSPLRYAILSHRWGEEEVLYKDFTTDSTEAKQKLKHKKGYAKVEGACKRAAKDGYDHIWIDSCCINQDSSAELSESINSMYRFYQEAQVCYAFLAGLPNDAALDRDGAFGTHEWFTRGWTLQELIASTNMEFYTDELVGECRTTNWVHLATKKSICEQLSAITHIDAAILSHESQVAHVSVAKRMSWAANRETTKPEDHAYSLLGLFDVNMPMIYGEGKTKAFLRLQGEIMKVSSDQSIFAWQDAEAAPDAGTGVLATSPEMFKASGSFISYYEWERVKPITQTNIGLQITLPLRLVEPGIFEAALNCTQPERLDGFAGIYLRAMSSIDGYNEDDQRYERVRSWKMASIPESSSRGDVKEVTVRNSGSRVLTPVIYPNHMIQLRRGPRDVGWTLYGTMGNVSPIQLMFKDTEWIPGSLASAFKLPKERCRLAAVVVFARPDGTKVTVLLGSSNNVDDVGVQVLNEYSHRTFSEWAHIFRPRGSGKSNTWNIGREVVYVESPWKVQHLYKYYVADFNVTLNQIEGEGQELFDKEYQESVATTSQDTDDDRSPRMSWGSKMKSVLKGSRIP